MSERDLTILNQNNVPIRREWSEEQKAFLPLCAPTPKLPDAPEYLDKYRDSIQFYGAANVEAALIFTAQPPGFFGAINFRVSSSS